VVATAILDRFLHHSHVITIRGDSYRLKEKHRSGLPRPKEKRRRKAECCSEPVSVDRRASVWLRSAPKPDVNARPCGLVAKCPAMCRTWAKLRSSSRPLRRL
jgi:hypothetical protein